VTGFSLENGGTVSSFATAVFDEDGIAATWLHTPYAAQSSWAHFDADTDLDYGEMRETKMRGVARALTSDGAGRIVVVGAVRSSLVETPPAGADLKALVALPA
jgi:hypothetical protein